MKPRNPKVSVVIPTYCRPDAVLRAVQSALNQTLRELEVIVVPDGPDPATEQRLQQIDDPRLRIAGLPHNSGVSEARNHGIRLATAEWIAFLDDDDEWMPEKLDLQHRSAIASPSTFPIVSCRFLARQKRGDLIWPHRLPAAGERIDEYLFCQHSLFGGEGMVLPSTLFTKRELVLQIPFLPVLRRHQDIDWLLRACSVQGCGVEFVPDSRPLAIWNMADSIPRMSNTADWLDSLNWARANRQLLSKKAISGFLLTWASVAASQQRSWRAFLRLPVEGFRMGAPRLVDLSAHLLIWSTPQSLRTWISVLLRGA